MSNDTEAMPAPSRQSTLYYTPNETPVLSRKSTVQTVTLPEISKTRASTADNISKGYVCSSACNLNEAYLAFQDSDDSTQEPAAALQRTEWFSTVRKSQY